MNKYLNNWISADCSWQWMNDLLFSAMMNYRLIRKKQTTKSDGLRRKECDRSRGSTSLIRQANEQYMIAKAEHLQCSACVSDYLQLRIHTYIKYLRITSFSMRGRNIISNGNNSITKGSVLLCRRLQITIRSASFASLSQASSTTNSTKTPVRGGFHHHQRYFSYSQTKMAPRDPNTLANYGEWLTKHTTVNFKVNFEKQRLEGSVLLELESLTDKKSREVILGGCFMFLDSQTKRSHSLTGVHRHKLSDRPLG